MSGVCMSQVIVEKAFTTVDSNSEKKDLVSALAQALVDARALAEEHHAAVVDGSMAREAIGSTGIGHGIAIPHCRTDLVDTIVCAYGRCPDGVDFDSLDGEPVYSIFFLLTPTERKDDHLSLMKNFASQIRKDHFCDFLRQAEDAKNLVNLLAEFEEN